MPVDRYSHLKVDSLPAVVSHARGVISLDFVRGLSVKSLTNLTDIRHFSNSILETVYSGNLMNQD